MKKILSLVLCTLVALSLTACSILDSSSDVVSDSETLSSSETTVSQNESNSKIASSSKSGSSSKVESVPKTDKSSSKKSKKTENSESSKLAEKDLGNVITNTVNITIPAEFLGTDEKPFDYQLTEENKANGFTEIKKNDDGSATYTIKQDDYNKFISELKNQTKNSLESIVTEGTYTSIKKINYNDDFSQITLTVDKAAYEKSLDAFAIMGCGLTASFYQIYDLDAKQGCVINVKDEATGEIFSTETYPQ